MGASKGTSRRNRAMTCARKRDMMMRRAASNFNDGD